MKIILIVMTLVLCANVKGQSLENTEWVQIKAERKDSSRIVSRIGSNNSKLKFLFKNNIAYILSGNNLSQKTDFTILDNSLFIGKFSQYKIEKNDGFFLTLCQFSKNNDVTDDKLNRYYFVKSSFLLSYLTENNLISEITNDTLYANTFLYPSYYGELGSSFNNVFNSTKKEKEIQGSFFINSKNEISNIVIEITKGKLSKIENNEIISIIQNSSKGWSIPYTNKPFVYRVDFNLALQYISPAYLIRFSFGKEVKINNSTKSGGLFKNSDAEKYFIDGNESFMKENFNNAIKQYSNCIANDSLYIDAYYNLAFCYQKTNNVEMACKTWAILKQMGQKQGEYLLAENCK